MINKVVKVHWIDSTNHTTTWSLLDDIRDDKPTDIISYGFLIKEEPDYIVIAQNYGNNPPQVSNLLTIPKGCIKQIKYLNYEKV